MKKLFSLWLLFFLILFCAINCKEHKTDVQSDLANIEKVIRDFPKAAESYDFEKIQTLVEPTLVWIEEAPPVTFDKMIGLFKMFDSLKVQITYSELRDLKIQEQGNVAWAYWIVDGSFKTDTEKAKELLRAATGTNDLSQTEWWLTFAESAVLHRTDGVWRLVFGHTSHLPFIKQ